MNSLALTDPAPCIYIVPLHYSVVGTDIFSSALRWMFIPSFDCNFLFCTFHEEKKAYAFFRSDLKV